MPRPRRAALLAAPLSLLLLAPVAGLTTSPASAEPGELPGQASSTAQEVVPDAVDQAQDALGEVELLLADGVGGAAAPATPGSEDAEDRDLTLALSELALTQDALSGAEQREAQGYLSRPTDKTGAPYSAKYSVAEAPRTCGDDVCVHRVDSTGDAATQTYAQRVLETVEGVHDTYVGAGYRAPRADGAATRNGGDARTDVYLADLGEAGVYGYCTTDEPNRRDDRARWAYCVIDNDYDRDQYPAQTPLANMRVTVAHEYFHAVQFAYDIGEDPWLMEGTATWAEDEVFDGIDDNLAYLSRGPMGAPGRSLDLDKGGLEVYGAWGFWRFLTEQLPAAQGGMPTLVREVWEQADSLDGPDEYSLEALGTVLDQRGTSVRTAFADFVAANRFPAQRYEEGAAYPTAPAKDERVLDRRDTYSSRTRVGHLAGATLRLEPGAGTAKRNRALRVTVNLPPTLRGSELRVTVVRTGGEASTKAVALDEAGDARVRRPFSSRRVEAVEVHLVNASTRVQACNSGGAVSCQGFARDDRLRFATAAKVVIR